MPKIILKINHISDTVFDDENICCYLIDTAVGQEFISKFDPHGRLFLLCGDQAAACCMSPQIDGMVAELDLTQPIKIQVNKIRAAIGTKKVLGTVICPRRHEAMLVSETEPDFVAFKFTPEESTKAHEVISWYNELFLIQSALDMETVLSDAASYDTDFIIINSRDYKDFGC